MTPREKPKNTQTEAMRWGAQAPVEVVLCAFNGEKFIREQVDSILRQTVKPMRLSIYDDASTDNTAQVVREIIRSNESGIDVVLHVNSRNLGYVKNFECGIRNATLEFISLCDQDDIWEAEKLAVLLAAFEDDAGLVFSNALLIDEGGTSLKHTLWEAIGLTKARQVKFRSQTKARCLLLQQSYVTGAALVMRRSIVESLPSFPASAPHDYWIAIVAAETWRLKPVNSVLYRYRQHAKNVIGQRKFSVYRRVVNAIRNAEARYSSELQTYKSIAVALEGHPDLRVAHQRFRAKEEFLRARQEAVMRSPRRFLSLLRMLFLGKYRTFCRIGTGMFVKDACVLVIRSMRRLTGDT